MENSTICDAGYYAARFSITDYLVCCATLMVSAIIGIYYAIQARKSVASTSDVLMGGRAMGTFPMAMSLIASFMSAITLLGNPSEMYRYGTQFFVIGLAYFLLTPITAYLYMPVFYRLELTSAYEYLAQRFNNPVRQIGSAIFTFQMVMYMPIVVYAPSLALNQVTGINTYVAVTATFVVCIFYTSIGGLKAVMWTDAFQTMLMIGGMLAVVARGTFDVGGFETVWTHAHQSGRIEFFNFDLDPTTRHTFLSVLIGGTFMWGSIYAANQAQIQRYLSVPTIAQARNALWINCAGLIFLLCICCWGGLVMYAKYFDCDPLLSKKIQASDQLLPLFVMDTMADLPGVPGLFVAGIFSGALSTVSTGLSALSAITLTDFLPGCCGIKLEDSKAAVLSKWISVMFGVLSLALVFVVEQLGAVLQAALSIFGMVGGPVFGLFSLGMFVPWANSTGALVGTLCSLVTVCWLGIGAQIASLSGLIHISTRVSSVAGCECFNITMRDTDFMEDFGTSSVSAWYRISYMWYAPIAWIIVMTVGTIVSFLTTPQQLHCLDKRLLSPIVIWIMESLPFSMQSSLGWINEDAKVNAQSDINGKIVFIGNENRAYEAD